MTSGIRLQQAGQLKKLHTRQELSEEESLRLRKQVELIKSYIPDKEHVYHSYVIKNQIINGILNLDYNGWICYVWRRRTAPIVSSTGMCGLMRAG